MSRQPVKFEDSMHANFKISFTFNIVKSPAISMSVLRKYSYWGLGSTCSTAPCYHTHQ